MRRSSNTVLCGLAISWLLLLAGAPTSVRADPDDLPSDEEVLAARVEPRHRALLQAQIDSLRRWHGGSLAKAIETGREQLREAARTSPDSPLDAKVVFARPLGSQEVRDLQQELDATLHRLGWGAETPEGIVGSEVQEWRPGADALESFERIRQAAQTSPPNRQIVLPPEDLEKYERTQRALATLPPQFVYMGVAARPEALLALEARDARILAVQRSVLPRPDPLLRFPLPPPDPNNPRVLR